MITGKNEFGQNYVYDLPNEIKTAAEFESLIYGYHFSYKTRDELQGQPLLLGLAGPMFNGFSRIKETGEKVVIIRYEKQERNL